MAEIPLELTVHRSALPERSAAGLLRQLRRGTLPGWWLYQSPAQARRWAAYHRAYAPSRTDHRMAALFREAFTWTAARMGGAPTALVGLGCGDGRKDRELLKFLTRSAGPQPRSGLAYFPLDSSPPLVREAALRVKKALPAVRLRALVADLSSEPALRRWLPPRLSGPRLFTCFGVVPTLDSRSFPRYLGHLPARGDGLLLSANLSPEGLEADRALILPQYDNPPAHRWYEGALEALGVPAGAAVLAVGAEPLAPDGSAWRVVVEAVFRERVSLNGLGKVLVLPRGARLEVFFSNRFTAPAFRKVLASAGLTREREWIHPSGEEGVFFCTRGVPRRREHP